MRAPPEFGFDLTTPSKCRLGADSGFEIGIESDFDRAGRQRFCCVLAFLGAGFVTDRIVA
jgi:hypothetical protein